MKVRFLRPRRSDTAGGRPRPRTRIGVIARIAAVVMFAGTVAPVAFAGPAMADKCYTPYCGAVVYNETDNNFSILIANNWCWQWQHERFGDHLDQPYKEGSPNPCIDPSNFNNKSAVYGDYELPARQNSSMNDTFREYYDVDAFRGYRDCITNYTLNGSGGQLNQVGKQSRWIRLHGGDRLIITSIRCGGRAAGLPEGPSWFPRIVIPADEGMGTAPGGGGTGSGTGTGTGSTIPSPENIPAAFQANTGFLYTRSGAGAMLDTRYGMMNGTSPATSGGQTAFQANTGFLYTRNTNGAMLDTGFGMMNGTSPAISGGQIAFQANTTMLYTRNMNTGATQDLQLGMMRGTSPSIAGDTSRWRIAFQANTGFLYTRDSSGAVVNTGYGMMAGTSPSITALPTGGYAIAFQANTGFLYVIDSNGRARDTGYGMMNGTSPAISATPVGYTTAFQANTGFLYVHTNTGITKDTGFGMMRGTSPAIRGYRIVFQANTGFLWVRDGERAVDTGYGMMTGTSPAV
ncbi:hypothetical protein GCM10010166_61370 [Couchioplanes caeruleus subsp. azureus]|nr:hypothetical protein GCM10010166_61370 [Couchioplanes caeruleus subsp. azureus]